MPPLAPAPTIAPNSYRDVLLNDYQSAYFKSHYEPFVWPYRALGPNLLIWYLLLPPTNNYYVYILRYPLFVAIVYFSIESILECRSPMVTTGYGIGLLNAWTILWSATLIIFNDARADFRRIEGHEKSADAKWKAGNVENMNGNAHTPAAASGREQSLKGAILRAGHLDKRKDDRVNDKKGINGADDDKQNVWQSLPANFSHRLDWVADVACSFRGPRWSYQISGLYPPPRHIQASLKDDTFKPPVLGSQLTRADLLRYNLPYFAVVVTVLDGLKTLAMQDPYFWSLGPTAPSPFPFSQLTRALLSVSMTFFSLQGIFILSPLVYAVLLGPEWIGEHAQPWLYAPYFGSLRNVSQRGLTGAWGRWWQQVFRFGFEQGGAFAARMLGGDGTGWGKKSQKGIMLRAIIAFTLSGTLHACASYTSMLPTKPLHAFTFFAVQPIGLFGQKALANWMKKNGWREKIPWWVREAGNIVFVFLWFYLTGPIVADDFAAAGVWLYEPVPFSIFRGLSGQGWWFWGGTWARWHTDKLWWKSGFAF